MLNRTPVEEAYCSYLQQTRDGQYASQLERYYDTGEYVVRDKGTLKHNQHALFHSHKVLTHAKTVHSPQTGTVKKTVVQQRVCVLKIMSAEFEEVTVLEAVASRETVEVLSDTQVILRFNVDKNVAIPETGYVVVSALDDDNPADDIIQSYSAVVTEETTMISSTEELVRVSLVSTERRAASLLYKFPQSFLEMVRDIKTAALVSVGLLVTVDPDPVALDQLNAYASIGEQISKTAKSQSINADLGGGAQTNEQQMVRTAVQQFLTKTNLNGTCVASVQSVGMTSPENQFYVSGVQNRTTYSFPSMTRVLVTASVKLYYNNNREEIEERADSVFTRLFNREAGDKANRVRDVYVDAVHSRHSKNRGTFVSPLQIYAMLLIARERAENLAKGSLTISSLGDAILGMFRREYGNSADAQDPSFLRFVPLINDLLAGSSGLPVNLFSDPEKLLTELMTLKISEKKVITRDDLEKYIAMHLATSEPIGAAGTVVHQSPVANLVTAMLVPKVDVILKEFLTQTLRVVPTVASADYNVSGGLLGYLLMESITDVDIKNMLATVVMTHDAALALVQIAVRVSLRSADATPFQRALSWAMTDLINIYDENETVRQFIRSEQALISWGYAQPSSYETQSGIQLLNKQFSDGRFDVYGFTAAIQATQRYTRQAAGDAAWWSCTRVFYSFATTNVENQPSGLPYSTALLMDMSTGIAVVCTFLPDASGNLVLDTDTQLKVVTEFVDMCERLQSDLLSEGVRKIVAKDGLRVLRRASDITHVMKSSAATAKEASLKNPPTNKRNAAEYFAMIKEEILGKELVFFAGRYSLQSRNMTVELTGEASDQPAPPLILTISSGGSAAPMQIRVKFDPTFEIGEYRVVRTESAAATEFDVPVYFRTITNYGDAKIKVVLVLYNSDLYTDILTAPKLILQQATTVDSDLNGTSDAAKTPSSSPDVTVLMANSKFKTLVSTRKELAGPQETKSKQRSLSKAGLINGPLQAIGQVAFYGPPYGYYAPDYGVGVGGIIPFIGGVALGALLTRPRHRHYYPPRREIPPWAYRRYW